MEMKIIRSNRKTMAIQIRWNQIVVRAPLRVSDAEIRRFVQKHQPWIEKNRAQMQVQQAAAVQKALTSTEIQRLKEKAMQIIPERVRHYAPLVGVSYGRVTIRLQRTRWGSCSSKGNLNFNCLLLLAPPEVLDSVVVHELCHRKEMNHSPRFYTEVLRVFPAYHKWHQWLREHGSELMHRAERNNSLQE